MSKAPKITRLPSSHLREALVIGRDEILLVFHGRTERNAAHEIRITLQVSQLPWTIRQLWRAFAYWRRKRREEVAHMEHIMGGAAELGEKEGDQT